MLFGSAPETAGSSRLFHVLLIYVATYRKIVKLRHKEGKNGIDQRLVFVAIAVNLRWSKEYSIQRATPDFHTLRFQEVMERKKRPGV